MTNELTIESARNWTDDQIRKAIVSGLDGMAESLLAACIAVTVAKERGIDVGKLAKMYDNAELIAGGKLSPKAAQRIGTHKKMIAAMVGLPFDLQERLAEGQKVKIAYRDKHTGAVRYAEQSIFEMDDIRLRLAFTDGGITPLEEQGKAVLVHVAFAEPAPKKAKIKPDAKTGELIIGKTRVSQDDLKQALAVLGLRISPIYGRTQRKA